MEPTDAIPSSALVRPFEGNRFVVTEKEDVIYSHTLFARDKPDSFNLTSRLRPPTSLRHFYELISSCVWDKVRMAVIALPHPLVAESLGSFNLNIYDIASSQASFESGWQWLLPRLSGCLKGLGLYQYVVKRGCEYITSSFYPNTFESTDKSFWVDRTRVRSIASYFAFQKELCSPCWAVFPAGAFRFLASGFHSWGLQSGM